MRRGGAYLRAAGERGGGERGGGGGRGWEAAATGGVVLIREEVEGVHDGADIAGIDGAAVRCWLVVVQVHVHADLQMRHTRINPLTFRKKKSFN